MGPAADFYTNHATQLGDLTGADDAFSGFHEAVSDNGQKTWILRCLKQEEVHPL